MARGQGDTESDSGAEGEQRIPQTKAQKSQAQAQKDKKRPEQDQSGTANGAKKPSTGPRAEESQKVLKNVFTAPIRIPH